MIIKELHIDGFGIFNGFSLTALDKGVNIILGNNETGKSTLLKFLRFTLFGYPRYWDQRMAPLNGGNHSGRIKVILSSGKEALFERSGDDSINLRYNAQETQNQSQWSRLLGNASAELYNNVYAFSLEELVKLDSLSQSGVEDKIFSVGLGLGSTSIGEVESTIQTTIDNIYTIRGRVQLIPTIFKELESKKAKIHEIQGNLPKYQSLIQEIKSLEKSSNELDEQINKLRIEKNKLDNYIKCYDGFITITKADEALKNLPELQDYQAKGVEQLEMLEKEEKQLNDRILELRNGTKDEKGIVELGKEIKNITLNSKLLEKQDKVEYLRENLEKYKQALTEKNEEEQRIKDYQQSIKQGIADINGQWTEQDVTRLTNLTIHKNKFEGFKREIESLFNNKRDLEAQLKAFQSKISPLNAKNIINLISAIFLIGSIPGFYYGLYVFGGALLLIALLLFSGKKYLVKEEFDNQLQNQLDLLKIDEKKIKEEYENYLEQQLNLTKSLSPEATLDVFKSIEQIKKEIIERDKLNEKVNKQRLPFIQEFEKQASSLTDILKRKKQAENIEILVNQIITEFDSSRKQSDIKAKLNEDLGRYIREVESTESKLEQTNTEINELINSINARDRNDFRGKYEENNKVKDYTETKDATIDTIEKIVGRNKVSEVITYLKDNEKEIVEIEINRLDSEIQSKSIEYKELNSQLGGKKNEILNVEGESELAEVLTELETEKHKLKNAYNDWLTGKIALKILMEVKEQYEKEKQPEVIKKSSNYFREITRDRYKRIRVSLDKKEVVIYDSKEVAKKIEHLSRGTKEQLLISLRLGFIEEYEKQAELLPVIVDEVLVNFDPYRAKQIAEIFQRFGKNRQILIFTCHPSTIDHFDNSSIHLIQIQENGLQKTII